MKEQELRGKKKKKKPRKVEENPCWEMDDLEDPNMVLMEGIGKAIEVLLREEVGFILGCKQARREATSSPC